MKGKLIKQKGIGFQTIDGSDYFLTIDEKVYHTNPLTAGLVDGGKLSYKNCQAIERGYDLDELADFYSKSTLFVSDEVPTEKQIEDAEHISEIAFKEGFRKSLELMGDKKFSEEDLMEAYSRGQTNSPIQSLQKTEWDVEFEMEYVGECNGNNDNGCFQDSPGHNCGCFERKPKLDDEGFLILKKYKNG